MHLVTAPDRRGLGQAVADELGAELVVYERKRFPDGELYVRLPQAVDAETALVADLWSSDRLVEALLASDAAREAGADTVTALVPYLSYARQDRAFEPGEAISARAVARALSTGADHLVTVDVHTPSVLGFFEGATAGETATPEIARALAERGVDLVLAPDAGARERAERVAENLGCAADHLEKTRVSATEVSMATKELDVQGATVAIVDDIISTGGTMATATGELLGAGASRVLVAATHGVFAEGATERLEKAGVDAVLVADTLVHDRAVISCAPALARGWQRVQEA